MHSDTLDDVIRRCQQGDEQAMEMLYVRYKTRLFTLAFRFCYSRCDAEDLLQEIFIKVLRNIRNLRSTKAFNTWLYRIAVNTCISAASKQSSTVSLKTFDEDAHHPGTTEHSIPEGIEQAVRMLPPKQRSVFLLHDVQGMTHKEIARILKCSNGTSKSQLFNARMKIRAHLKRE